ncbi:phosphoribosylaminoimidazolesuccinocarboxamide synthase [Trueperella sp. LYQ143]|uniref:phosphoribosylaminoimidazolesuccinocarboxamide synthase n=1 Tax=unclassified Trueperella TaxID=2630174 RepID=UPI0039831B07
MSSPSFLTIPNWTRIYTGKVHDIYLPAGAPAYSGSETMMFVASDRISVHDRVLPATIPGKGILLTDIAAWWFDQLADIVPTHYLSLNVPSEVAGRAMIVRRLRMFPVECSVVGYVTESVAEEYQCAQTIGGIAQPEGLEIGQQLPKPVFIPAVKGAVGADDQIISPVQAQRLLGVNQARRLSSLSVELYRRANEISAERGLVIAECKLEFGSSADEGDEEYVLADQAFTPDSATYWLKSEVDCGVPRVFGKDYLRKAISEDVSAWTHGGAAPVVAEDVLAEMAERYAFVREKLC